VSSADGLGTDLDLVPASGPVQVLRSQLVADGGSFDSPRYTAGRLYWMHTVPNADGVGHVSLWTAARTGNCPATSVPGRIAT
jgi:hypothetical protein